MGVDPLEIVDCEDERAKRHHRPVRRLEDRECGLTPALLGSEHQRRKARAMVRNRGQTPNEVSNCREGDRLGGLETRHDNGPVRIRSAKGFEEQPRFSGTRLPGDETSRRSAAMPRPRDQRAQCPELVRAANEWNAHRLREYDRTGSSHARNAPTWYV